MQNNPTYHQPFCSTEVLGPQLPLKETSKEKSLSAGQFVLQVRTKSQNLSSSNLSIICHIFLVCYLLLKACHWTFLSNTKGILTYFNMCQLRMFWPETLSKCCASHARFLFYPPPPYFFSPLIGFQGLFFCGAFASFTAFSTFFLCSFPLNQTLIYAHFQDCLH